MKLKQKIVLVTGAGSGIGRETSILFAKEGASVISLDSNYFSAVETVEALKKYNKNSIAFECDVSRNKDIKEVLRNVKKNYGTIDIIFNGAGIHSRNLSLENASDEQIWDRVIEVNLKGTYLVNYYFAPLMKEKKSGSIINVSSIMGLVGYSKGFGVGFDAYPPSKGAIIQLTRNLSLDLAKYNVRVNCICPGYVKTNLTKALHEDNDRLKELEAKHPMGRLGTPLEIAKTALFLASNDASFITGSSIVVDGGYTAQ